MISSQQKCAHIVLYLIVKYYADKIKYKKIELDVESHTQQKKPGKLVKAKYEITDFKTFLPLIA